METEFPIFNGRLNNGRFAKGNAGGGRKATPQHIKDLFEGASEDSANLLIRFVRDENVDSKLRVQCAETILDRAYGKAKQFVESNINATVENKLNVSKLSTAELLELEALIEKAQAESTK